MPKLNKQAGASKPRRPAKVPAPAPVPTPDPALTPQPYPVPAEVQNPHHAVVGRKGVASTVASADPRLAAALKALAPVIEELKNTALPSHVDVHAQRFLDLVAELPDA